MSFTHKTCQTHEETYLMGEGDECSLIFSLGAISGRPPWDVPTEGQGGTHQENMLFRRRGRWPLISVNGRQSTEFVIRVEDDPSLLSRPVFRIRDSAAVQRFHVRLPRQRGDRIIAGQASG